jgi:hypothetical protein
MMRRNKMRHKFRFLMAGVIALGLLIAGTASALAGSEAESITDLAETNELSANEVDSLITELEELEDIHILPKPDDGAEIKILGGFHGRWGVDEAEDPLGGLAGIYGSITYEDGTGYGFLGGIWKQRDEKAVGYLIGKYDDDAFWGIYRNYAGENGGKFGGTYAVADSDVEALINRFAGQWESSDGESSGYVKGTWAQKVGIRRVGKFGGKWFYNDDEAEVTSERPRPDGQFRGHYGTMKLADDTVIHLFRGGWLSEEGNVGKLTGIGIRGHFYGIWRGEDESGYMMGKAKDHRMRGVWGTFGEEEQGRLHGRYGRTPKPDQVEPEEVEPELVPSEDPALEPAA